MGVRGIEARDGPLHGFIGQSPKGTSSLFGFPRDMEVRDPGLEKENIAEHGRPCFSPFLFLISLFLRLTSS